MKKLLSLMLVFAIVALSGCGSKETANDTKKPSDSKVVEQEKPKDPFLAMMAENDRPLAVMIDNDGPSSRPQCGLENAYMVYEIIVEGGATRMMAIFKNVVMMENPVKQQDIQC